jgi:hypothetical protein
MTGSKKVRFAELEARGWTREIAGLYGLRPRSHWWEIDEALRIEKSGRWQRDRDAVARGETIVFTKAMLIPRGWTDGSIKTFLGEPDHVVDLPKKRKAFYWRSGRVLHAEASPEWQEKAQKVLSERPKRSAAVQQVMDTKIAAVKAASEEQVESLWIRVPAGSTISGLTEKAIRSQVDWLREKKGIDYNVSKMTDADRAKWLRNYVRHELTNYDTLLRGLSARFRGQPGVVAMYEEVVRPHVDRMVEDALAELPDHP